MKVLQIWTIKYENSKHSEKSITISGKIERINYGEIIEVILQKKRKKPYYC